MTRAVGGWLADAGGGLATGIILTVASRGPIDEEPPKEGPVEQFFL